jgi:hypothetical protein
MSAYALAILVLVLLKYWTHENLFLFAHFCDFLCKFVQFIRCLLIAQTRVEVHAQTRVEVHQK